MYSPICRHPFCSKLMNIGWTKERIAQLLKEKAVSESESIYGTLYGTLGEEDPIQE